MSCFRFAVVVGWASSCLLVIVARFRVGLCGGVGFFCGVGCWCMLYGFRLVSPTNKSDTFFLINEYGKDFVFVSKKKTRGLL